MVSETPHPVLLPTYQIASLLASTASCKSFLLSGARRRGLGKAWEGGFAWQGRYGEQSVVKE